MYMQFMTMDPPSYGKFIGYVAMHIKKIGEAMMFGYDNTTTTIQFRPNESFQLSKLDNFDMQMPLSWVTVRQFMIHMYDHSRSDKDQNGNNICGKLSGVVQLFEGVRQSLEMYETPDGLQKFVQRLQKHSETKKK